MAAKSGTELLSACSRVFARIGTPEGYNGSKCSSINDPQAAAVLEYAVASHLEKQAKTRKEVARAEVMARLAENLSSVTLGPKINVFGSPHANLDVQLVKGQSRLNRDKLFVALTKALGSASKATVLLEECTEQGEPTLRMSPIIVAVGD